MRGVLAFLLVALVIAAGMFWFLPRLQEGSPEPDATPVVADEAASVPAAPEATGTEADQPGTRRITARLFYVAQDGLHLASVEQEVPYGSDAVEQARLILEAELQPPPEPLTSAIPEGTEIRNVFLSEGDVYVDLTGAIAAGHPGGSLNELFTVYAIVNALTVNLPAVSGVQILVDGQEVDTLAGHVDLRRPLQQDSSWIARTQTETLQP